jgi:signal transduction histidine kinase
MARREEKARTKVSEDREKMLVNINEGIVAFDKMGKVLFANRFAVNSVFGADKKQESGKAGRVWILLDERGTPLPDGLQPAKASTKGVDAESLQNAKPHLRRPDGSLFPVGVLVVEVESQDGPNLVMSFRDLTKETEIDKMKTDFISMAVHQIKTPLTALKWSVEVLSAAAQEKSVEEKEALQSVFEVTQRLNELVTSLLNISRIESGRLTVDPAPTDIGSLAADAIKEAKTLAVRKNVNLHFSVEPGLPTVNLDRILVHEVYKNLLTNAIKYSPAGSDVHISINRKDDLIVSSVRDEGIGIPESEKHRIFDRFFRASNVAKQPEDGTGLGLYFAKKIVELSGGRIWLDSTEGAGSTFYFNVPVTGSQARKGEVRLS